MPEHDLALLVPSRGRPDNIRRLLLACRNSAPAVDVYVGVDADDPSLTDYEMLVPEHIRPGQLVTLPETTRPGMVRALNMLAAHCLGRYEMLGFMGDDHLPHGTWATQMIATLHRMGTGMVYGDDGIQGPLLPTAIVMTADIVEVLGYMAPPKLNHLWVDNAWLELGNAAHCLTYLPQVQITHLHPSVGLTEWDDSYRSNNSPETNTRDHDAFDLWHQSELPADVRRIQGLTHQR